jgi:hypothetical protein
VIKCCGYLLFNDNLKYYRYPRIINTITNILYLVLIFTNMNTLIINLQILQYEKPRKYYLFKSIIILFIFSIISENDTCKNVYFFLKACLFKRQGYDFWIVLARVPKSLVSLNNNNHNMMSVYRIPLYRDAI